MSFAELVLIFLVAVIVFGPKQLPMVARHLGLVINTLAQLKEKAAQVWNTQVKEWQLLDNEQKAADADKHYQSSESSGNRSTNE